MEKLIKNSDLGIDISKNSGRVVSNFVMKFLKFDSINALVADIDDYNTVDFARTLLNKLDIEIDCSEYNIENIPTKGGFIAVANFPHGILDCLALLHIIGNSRKDIKFFMGNELSQLSVLDKFVIKSNDDTKISKIRNAVKHLLNGGVLIVFPAGMVEGYDRFLLHTQEHPWQYASLVKLAKITKNPIVPFAISGRPSKISMIFNKIFTRGAGLLLVREFLRNKSVNIDIAVAKPLYYSEVVKISRTQKDEINQQHRVVAETLRGALFLQMIKFSENYNNQSITHKTNLNFVEPHIIDLSKLTPIIEKGQIKLYVSENQLIIYNGSQPMFYAKFSEYDFSDLKTVANMYCSADFELNLRKLSKTMKSCVELVDVEVNYGLAESGKVALEEMLKGFIKFSNVDGIMVNVKHKQVTMNLTTAVFNKYIESYNMKGLLKHAILPRGNFYHGHYIGHTLKTESKHFYSPALFAKYAQEIDYLDISPELLLFLNIGAKIGAVSGRLHNDTPNHSFLLILQ